MAGGGLEQPVRAGYPALARQPVTTPQEHPPLLFLSTLFPFRDPFVMKIHQTCDIRVILDR